MAAKKALANYRQAEEFSHFGSELALSAHNGLARGKSILELFSQPPTITYSFIEQQLMLDIILHLEDTSSLDVKKLKANVKQFAEQVKSDDDFDRIKDQLQQQSMASLVTDLPSIDEGITQLTSTDTVESAGDTDKASTEDTIKVDADGQVTTVKPDDKEKGS